MVFLGKFAALAVSGAQLGTNTTWNREEACRSREGLLEECFTSNGKCLQLFAIVMLCYIWYPLWFWTNRLFCCHLDFLGHHGLGRYCVEGVLCWRCSPAGVKFSKFFKLQKQTPNKQYFGLILFEIMSPHILQFRLKYSGAVTVPFKASQSLCGYLLILKG